MKNEIAFTLAANGTTTSLRFPVTQAVIAGWTGRDPVARDKHIAELAAIGIAPPASTPIYYRCAARRITTADSIECTGTDSSGEVEKEVAVNVLDRQAVAAGDVLMVIEAMKMEHTITAPADGVVKEVHFAAGEQVLEGAELITLE